MPPLGSEQAASFEDAMLKAMDGVNALQADSSNALEAMLTDPDSIDAHDVTIAMAKANMSLNITRTVLDRVVRAWKDILNTR
jgi:flagellar hook-basal body complex protein FliE